MNNIRLKFFDGSVFHKRVGSKMHKFRYPYKSTFIEEVYDFNSESYLYAHSKIVSFEKKYSDMSERYLRTAAGQPLKPSSYWDGGGQHTLTNSCPRLRVPCSEVA